MNDFRSMRIADRFCDSAHEVHAGVDAELIAPLLKVMIEADRAGVVIEDKSGAQVALD